MAWNNDDCVDESARECDNVSNILCYTADIVDDCCDTCFRLSTTDPLCRYGDKELGCLSSMCLEYSDERRLSCCFTCANFTNGNGNLSNVSSRGTKTMLPHQGSDLQGWVVPVSASSAGILLLLLSIIVFLLVRRTKCRPHTIPKHNLKRKDWGFVIQRAPLPPPRPEVTNRFQDCDHTYDYAEPEYVQIPSPGVYLELVNPGSGDNQQSMCSDMCADYKVNKRAPQPLPRSDDGEANARQNEKVMVRTQFNDYRTRRQMKQQPSIRDYKVNKRAPLPLPRSDDETNARQNEKVMVRTQIDDYGYEKPIQSKTSRQMEQQSSIQEPHKYLDFSNTAYEEPHEYLDFSNPADEEYATIP